jgi:hypothetical protein
MSYNSSVLMNIWAAIGAGIIFLWLLLVELHARRRPQSPECRCRSAVPVHIVTGEQVSTWCPDCGKTVYMARWVFRGE